ncbi:MAG: zinc ribbon domain-containing protein [Nitrospinae bacterium]|nr:zinc ribbon domain-containing protein [Nitrospinota bacterium]
MSLRKVEDAAAGETSEYQTCPKCGLPHKLSDTVCAYCGEKLPQKVSLTEKLKRIVERARWRYKLKARRPSVKSVSGKITALLIGAGLLGGAVFFLYRAITGQEFMDFLIGAILAIYGGYITANTFRAGKANPR